MGNLPNGLFKTKKKNSFKRLFLPTTTCSQGILKKIFWTLFIIPPPPKQALTHLHRKLKDISLASEIKSEEPGHEHEMIFFLPTKKQVAMKRVFLTPKKPVPTKLVLYPAVKLFFHKTNYLTYHETIFLCQHETNN